MIIVVSVQIQYSYVVDGLFWDISTVLNYVCFLLCVKCSFPVILWLEKPLFKPLQNIRQLSFILPKKITVYNYYYMYVEIK